MAYSVAHVEGVPENSRRGVAFLRSTDDKEVNAWTKFGSLKEKQKRDVLARFDHWLSGLTHDRYFHGWPNDPGNRACFVFKWKQDRTNHRFYGFLMNPRQSSNPKFQACVLVSYAQKTKHETDPAVLRFINQIRGDPRVIGAVKRAFPE